MNWTTKNIQLKNQQKMDHNLTPSGNIESVDSQESGVVLFTGSFFMLLGSSLLMIMGIGVFYMFPLFVLKIGGNRADIGYLMGAMSLASVIGRPWASNLVDRIGRKKSMMIGCLVMALVSLAHLLLREDLSVVYPVLVLLRFIFGAALALGIVASLTMAADMVAGPRLNEGLGLFGIMPMLGLALGPLLGEFLVTKLGFEAMFWGSAAIFTISMLLIYPMKDRFVASTTVRIGGFFRVLALPLVWRMALIALFFGAAFAAHAGFVTPFAHARDLPVSLYFISYSTAAILSRLFCGWLARLFGETRIIAAALLVGGIGFISLLMVSSSFGLMVAGFVAGLGQGLLFPSLVALTIRPMVQSNRGKVAGTLTGGFDGGIFFGSLMMGQLGEFFGFNAIFGLAAATAFLGLIIFLAIQSKIVEYGR